VGTRIELSIAPQPDETTCGPTCLHALYRYWGYDVPLRQVIGEVDALAEGGTLGVLLGCHALKRGFRAAIYSYNLHLFDPTWFGSAADNLRERLAAQRKYKRDRKLQVATAAYLEFLELGGELLFEELSGRLIRSYLDRDRPLLTGLSATYLYRTPRERIEGTKSEYDELRGEPAGHFVVLCGYDRESRKTLVADPLYPNPLGEGPVYEVGLDRLIGAILLGVLTYDANLLLVEPKAGPIRSGPGS
jgi:hypothetical protein